MGDDAATDSCRTAVFGSVDAICEGAILAGILACVGTDELRVWLRSTELRFFRFGTEFTV
jgi:hypothetical protein